MPGEELKEGEDEGFQGVDEVRSHQFADGSFYDGMWRGTRRHGDGTYKYPSGATYTGPFVNDYREGEQGTMEYADRTKYVGGWRNDMRHGEGRYEWLDGSFYKGHFASDMMHGEGTITWPDTQSKDGFSSYTGSWRDNMRDGHGIMKYKDGSEYEGGWQSDKRHGHGKMSYADGSEYVGHFYEG